MVAIHAHEWLWLTDCTPAATFCVVYIIQVCVVRTGFPATTLQVLRYLCAPGEEAAKGLAAFGRPASPETEAKVAELLVHACRRELNELGRLGCWGEAVGLGGWQAW